MCHQLCSSWRCWRCIGRSDDVAADMAQSGLVAATPARPWLAAGAGTSSSAPLPGDQGQHRRVGDAKARLRAMRSRRSSLDQQTQSIAEQVVAVRSGSALLEQVRRVTPQSVRLVSVDANPSKLLIKGESQGTDAFQRINALDLNLEALPGMLLDGTTVVKAQADKQGRIAFSLEAKLDPAMKSTPEHLRGLGAEGLAHRLELLQGEGLLP